MVVYHFRTKQGPDSGPIDADEFHRRLAAGEIDDDTMVWRSGMLDWAPYSKLRASEPARSPVSGEEPPPLPGQLAAAAKVTAAAVAPAPAPKPAAPARPAVQFQACASCQQEWPENLLFGEGSKKICGNCERRRKDDPKYKKSSSRNTKSSGGVSVSSGWGTWLAKTVGIAIVCGGLMFAKSWVKYKVRKGNRSYQQSAAASPLPLR